MNPQTATGTEPNVPANPSNDDRRSAHGVWAHRGPTWCSLEPGPRRSGASSPLHHQIEPPPVTRVPITSPLCARRVEEDSGTSALTCPAPMVLAVAGVDGGPVMSVQQHHVPHPTQGSGSIPERLTIVLEPLHGGILRSIVNTLGTMGSGTWRFVAMTDAGGRVEGPTFVSPRGVERIRHPIRNGPPTCRPHWPTCSANWNGSDGEKPDGVRSSGAGPTVEQRLVGRQQAHHRGERVRT